MKYLLWLLYSFVAIAIAYIIPLLTVGEKIEANHEYFKSFEASEISDISTIEDEDIDALKLALVGVEVLQGENGKKDWQMQAKWLTYNATNRNLFAKEPELLYFDKAKKQPFKANASNGKVLNNNSLVEMSGNVKLIQDSINLSAPLLNFASSKDTFTLSKGVKINSPELLGRADTIIWNVKTNSIQAHNNVVFIFNPAHTTYTLNSAIKKAPIPKQR